MQKFDLDITLIDFSDKDGNSCWTIRDAVEGVQIFGGIGSGKTSGSGRMLALKYLSKGFGGLVLTAKPDEKEMWQEYCRLASREKDLIILEPGGKHIFNFLEFETSRSNTQAAITENIVQVLKTVIRSSEEKGGGKSDDPFWESALDMLIFNVIDLCMLAYGKASVEQMYNIVLTAPRNDEDSSKAEPIDKDKAFSKAFETAQKNILVEIETWEAALSPVQKKALEDSAFPDEIMAQALPNVRLMRFIDQFFIDSYRNLNDKTRSIIEFSFSGFLFRLLREPVYSLFCNGKTTVQPEDCLEGKIILLNLPVKIYHKVGRDSQILFKYVWQRSMEKRQVKLNDRPVFLWADEAQNFLHEHDAEYQATARSSRIATVYISQNLPNYNANMGGSKSDDRVKSFLGTLSTKIFHANADIDTNKYASELIGEAYMEDTSRTVTVAGDFSAGQTKSYKLERLVRPERLVSLKTGGPENKLQVEGMMHRQGKAFPDGFNRKLIKFRQDYVV